MEVNRGADQHRAACPVFDLKPGMNSAVSRKLQSDSNREKQLCIVEIQGTPVFLYHRAHLSQPKAVGFRVRLCGPQLPTGIGFHMTVERVFTLYRQDPAGTFLLEADEFLGPLWSPGGGLQGVVQQIHQQCTEIFIRDGQVSWDRG